MIRPAIMVEGGNDAQWHATADGERERKERELDGCRDPFTQFLRHRSPICDRLAPIAPKQISDIVEILEWERFVEPPPPFECCAHFRIVRLPLAQNERDRITRYGAA